jgi:polar amino acid transport system substrate-binding protein
MKSKFHAIIRFLTYVLAVLFLSVAAQAQQVAAPPASGKELRVAVYEAAPYGSLERNGLFSGASVELWRRVAEDQRWRYAFKSVASMDEILNGLQHGRYDAAIGAITITPERLTRVDFSYPAHPSGVAVAYARQNNMLAAFKAYGSVAGQLGALILTMLVLLLLTGILIWLSERYSRQQTSGEGEATISKLHEGLYWAVVTMTTVGYGDMTPRTHFGRAVAVAWMLGSLVLVSLLSTSIVAQLTAQQLTGSDDVRPGDLTGKKLGAATSSSGAEYLASRGLAFTGYPSLGAALDALAAHKIDAVVNSVGALEYLIANRYRSSIELEHGLLAPAFMGVALPPHSPLREPLDRSLVRITTGSEWPAIEAAYFSL